MTDPTAAAREKAREIVWHTTINAPVGSPKWYGEFWEVLAKELAAAEQRGRDAGLEETKIARQSALLVLCAIRDAQSWSVNMLKDIDFAIEANRAAPHKGADYDDV